MSENSRQGKSHIDSIVKQEEDALQRRTRSEPEVEAFPAIKTRLLVQPKRGQRESGRDFNALARHRPTSATSW